MFEIITMKAMCMQVYSRLATGKFPDFPATAAMVAKVFHFFNLHHLYLVLAMLVVANVAADSNTCVYIR